MLVKSISCNLEALTVETLVHPEGQHSYQDLGAGIHVHRTYHLE